MQFAHSVMEGTFKECPRDHLPCCNTCKPNSKNVLGTIYLTVIHANIMFTPARDFLLETPRRIIIPNPKSRVFPFDLDNQNRCEPFILCISQA
jgi:hypothetical protein